MMGVEWGTPPPAKKGARLGLLLLANIAELQARPGQWALVEDDAGYANRKDAYSAQGCESTSRTRPDGKFDIWARWPEASTNGEVH